MDKNTQPDTRITYVSRRPFTIVHCYFWIEDRSSGIDHLGSIIWDRSSGIDHPGSIIWDRSSGIDHPGSIIWDRSSGIAHPGSIIRDRSSGIDHLGSIIRDRSSGIAHPGSIIRDRSFGMGSVIGDWLSGIGHRPLRKPRATFSVLVCSRSRCMTCACANIILPRSFAFPVSCGEYDIRM